MVRKVLKRTEQYLSSGPWQFELYDFLFEHEQVRICALWLQAASKYDSLYAVFQNEPL